MRVNRYTHITVILGKDEQYAAETEKGFVFTVDKIDGCAAENSVRISGPGQDRNGNTLSINRQMTVPLSAIPLEVKREFAS